MRIVGDGCGLMIKLIDRWLELHLLCLSVGKIVIVFPIVHEYFNIFVRIGVYDLRNNSK